MHKVLNDDFHPKTWAFDRQKSWWLPFCGGDYSGLEYSWVFGIYFCDWTAVTAMSSLFLMLAFHRRLRQRCSDFRSGRLFGLVWGSELIGIHTGYLLRNYVYWTTWRQGCGRSRHFGVNWFIFGLYLQQVNDISQSHHMILCCATRAATAYDCHDYIMSRWPVALDSGYWSLRYISAE